MEHLLKVTSANNYLHNFHVAQLNFFLFVQEEKINKKRYRSKDILKANESR
jgi:hypothetical protein